MKLSDFPNLVLNSIIDVEEDCPWLSSTVNAVAINSVVNVCPHRPHPWSTVSDYVSWTSLTDQRWSARHLPAKDLPNLPALDDVVKIFGRPEGKQRLSSKSTCLFPAFAQYLTDGFIRTRMPHGNEPDDLRRQNTSNHQIDLCQLYGRIIAQTDVLRLKSETAGERGRLKTQVIGAEEYPPFLYSPDGLTPKAEFDVLDPPLGVSNITDNDQRAKLFAVGGDRVNTAPQVAMMNTLFLREHNRLAGEIEAAHPTWDDERVFQTARNTMIALFIKIVVEEYINHISPVPFRFKADPSVAWNAPWNKPNWITTEFSLLYRWHSLIPDEILWNGQNEPVGNTFLDNRFLLNTGLARSFSNLSSQAAGELGAFNTAQALMNAGIEKLAIWQGRLCRVASYSDYRAYVGLSRPTHFKDISHNMAVVQFLSATYSSVDDVEFYVGLFAEDVIHNSPLPELMERMVAVDAFSQALTNPLLSEHVFNEETFSTVGWNTLQNTSTLQDVLERNSAGGTGGAYIGMTTAGWKYRWP